MVDPLADAVCVAFATDGVGALGPGDERFEEKLVASADNDVANVSDFDGATDCARADAKKT